MNACYGGLYWGQTIKKILDREIKFVIWLTYRSSRVGPHSHVSHDSCNCLERTNTDDPRHWADPLALSKLQVNEKSTHEMFLYMVQDSKSKKVIFDLSLMT